MKASRSKGLKVKPPRNHCFLQEAFSFRKVEPHGQEPVAPMLPRNPPKLQSSFAKASEDTRIPPRSGDRGFLRRRVIHEILLTS
jgi:hypothetical protein